MALTRAAAGAEFGGPGPGQRLDGAFGRAVQRGGWDAEADDSGANFTRRIPGWRRRWSTSFPAGQHDPEPDHRACWFTAKQNQPPGRVSKTLDLPSPAGLLTRLSSCWEASALRYDRPRRVRPDGERAGELAAGADAELGEDLPEVVGDGGGADEQLRGDLRVGGPLAGQAGDQCLLRGQDVGCPGGAFERLRAGGPQLDVRPFGKRRGAGRVEDLVGGAQVLTRVEAAPLAAQPLAVEKAGAGEFHPLASAAEAVDCLAVEVLRGLAVADQRPRAGLGTKHPVGPAGAGDDGEALQGAGRALGYRAPYRRLDELDERPAGELHRRGVLARPLRRGQRLLITAQAVEQ